MSSFPGASAFAFALAAIACGASSSPNGDPDAAGPDRSDEFFAQALVEIAIELPDSDWDTLRRQYRSRVNLLGGEACSATPPGKVYDYFDARIDIDGERYESVGIRKKGFGSQSSIKPSLKIHLSRNDLSQQHLSLNRFAINNNKSDDTNLRQCFSYRLMDTAGLPTPRCTFANVHVNGEHLGVFTVLEEVRKPFLERHFGSSSGTLYEGESNDFRTELIGLEQDNNKDIDSSRADLERAREVLANATAETATADIASVFDLEGFYRFWATEVMIWHRDGYSGNLNNYFIYADPADSGRFKFIPWGTDNVMRDEARTTIPHSTLAFGIISNLLYQTAEGRARFYQELDELMATVWSEDDLAEWMAEKSALLEPHLRPADAPSFVPELEALSQTMLSRRQVFADARADGEPEWEAGLRGEICRYHRGTISGTVEANWNTLYPANYSAGQGTLSLTLGGVVAPPVATSGALSGLHDQGYDYIAVRYETTDNQRYFFRFYLPPPRFFDPVVPGVEMPLTSTAFFVGGSQTDLATGTRVATFELDEGTFNPTRLEKSEGGRVVIEFSASVYER